MFQIVSEHFANLRHVKRCKTCVSGLNTLFWSCKASILLHYTKNDVWEWFRAFRYPSVRKICKTCVSGLNALFWGTDLVKHPFYSIGPKMMLGSLSKHFANLRHVKRCKTCVSGLNALFWGIEVVKHPFYSIGPKMMFRIVSEDFVNIQHIKRCKTCVSGLNALFWGYRSWKAPILLHWTQRDVWECFRAFR
jgi:stress-induced morphogen